MADFEDHLKANLWSKFGEYKRWTKILIGGFEFEFES